MSLEYLAGQLSGRGNDHSSEATVGRLLQVSEQRETESQSLSRSRWSTGQHFPTLIHKQHTRKTSKKKKKHSTYTVHQQLTVCVCTHVHHERDGLHLYWRRGAQPGVSDVLEDARAEAILGLQLLKRAHGVGHVAAVHVYAVLRANTIHLEDKMQRKGSECRQSHTFTAGNIAS